MSKTANISARVDPDLKQNAEKILHQLGLTTTQAITLFLKQIELHKGLPFPIKIPNKTTVQAIEESRTPEKLDRFTSLSELYDDMGI